MSDQYDSNNPNKPVDRVRIVKEYRTAISDSQPHLEEIVSFIKRTTPYAEYGPPVCIRADGKTILQDIWQQPMVIWWDGNIVEIPKFLH